MLAITKHADKLFEVHKRYRKCRSKTAKKNVVEQFYHQNVQYVVVKNQDL